MTNRSKMWLKPTDQMDLWLETQGYYRKHTARDGTSLFRAVAEQLGLTQHFHLELRRQCVDYVLLFEDLFKDKLTCSLKEYEDRMRIPNEWGGEFELDVISRIYKCDFLIFQEVGQPAEDITGRGYDEKIMLCVSQERHYDSVYTKEHISDTAFCQSLVYEQLYKRAFNLIEVDFAVKKMLHDKAPRYQRDPCMSISGMALRLEMRDTCLNVKELLLLGVTPFPYKVAKSLDPEIYRNVEYDTWNDYRKGLRYGSRFWTSNELCVGVKCLVKLEDDKNFHGFIQEMEPDKGPVLVFIEELGEKMSVPYDCLELLPPPQPCCTTTAAGGSSKQLRQLQAKLALQAAAAAASAAQPDSTTAPQQQPPPPKKKTSDHRRLKSCQPNEAEAAPPAPDKRRNANSCGGDSANYDQHSMQSSNYLASASSDCYEHELDYQQDIPGSYQHVHMYPTQSCEVTSSSVNYPQHCEGGDHVMSPYAAASPSPTAVYQMSAPPGGSPAAPASTAAAAYCAALNLVPTRSVHADGSDLPMADLPTLRYYYNIGLDYMRMNTCLVAQAQQAQSAAGRPAVGGQLPPHWPAGQYHAYVPADSPVPVPLSYVSHCYEPQPAVSAYAEAGPAAAVPYPSPASVDYNSAVSADSAPPPPDSTSRVTASPNQPAVAPRFKNKRKNEQQTASAATSPSQVSNNKHQPSYSVASTTTPIPATVNAPAATATVSLPSSHFVPVYYHYPSTPATECDRNYCPGYYDSPHWMPYEVPGAAALYPAAAGAATLYSAPQQASYLATDGVYYMQPATIEY